MCAIGKSGEKTVVAKDKTYEVQENSVYHYRVHQRRAGCDRHCHSVFTLHSFFASCSLLLCEKFRETEYVVYQYKAVSG